MQSNVIMICWNIVKSNHLPLSPTSITCAPPSKDVGQKPSSTLLKQCGHWHHLPLPSPSALPCHSMSSIENTSPCLLPPSSLPHHLTLSTEDACPCLPLPLHTPLCHVTRRRALRTPLVHCPPPLVCHCPRASSALLFCHVTQRRVSRMPPVCHRPPLCHI